METIFHEKWFNEPDNYVDSIYFVCYAGKSTAPGNDFGCASTYKEAVEMCRLATEETGSPAHVCICRDESVDEENAYELGYQEGREFLKAHGVDEYEVVFETVPGLNDIIESYKQCKALFEEAMDSGAIESKEHSPYASARICCLHNAIRELYSILKSVDDSPLFYIGMSAEEVKAVIDELLEGTGYYIEGDVEEPFESPEYLAYGKPAMWNGKQLSMVSYNFKITNGEVTEPYALAIRD